MIPPALPPVPGTQTLTTGLAVLRAVAEGARTVSEIARRLDLSRSRAHRLAQALRLERFLRDSDDGLVLGAALIELGMHALAENPLAVVARPVLQDLAAEAKDTVHLAVADAGSVLYIAKIPGTRGAEMRSRVGYRMPLTRTGVGKALLLDHEDRWRELWSADAPDTAPDRGRTPEEFAGEMARYRTLGYTLDLEDNEPGIRCVAAPVRDATGTIVGAISVAATVPYMSVQRLRSLAPRVMGAARTIAGEMGYRSWKAGPARPLD